MDFLRHNYSIFRIAWHSEYSALLSILYCWSLNPVPNVWYRRYNTNWEMFRTVQSISKGKGQITPPYFRHVARLFSQLYRDPGPQVRFEISRIHVCTNAGSDSQVDGGALRQEENTREAGTASRSHRQGYRTFRIWNRGFGVSKSKIPCWLLQD